MRQDVKYGYDENGPFAILEVHYNWDEYVAFKLPPSCTACPIGFSSGHCGRNVPLEPEDRERRPVSCKLVEAELFK